MSTWHRSKCDKTGPNIGIYYGSLILNVLIIYAIIRVLFTNGWNAVAHWYNSNCLVDRPQRLTWIINKLNRLLACEPEHQSIPIIAIIFVLIFVLFLVIALVVTSRGGHLDGFSHIWYMLCGVMAAWLYECIFKMAFYPARLIQRPHRPSLLSWLWKKCEYIGYIRKFFLFPVFDAEIDDEVLSVTSEWWFESSYFWRFLPDVFFVLNWVILWGSGILNNPIIGSVFRWIIMQILSTVFLLISLLQRGESRLNFSRFVLETPFLKFVGNSSLYVYLLQIAAFSFYTPIIMDDIDAGDFPFSKDPSYYVTYMWKFVWFKALPPEKKYPGFVCIIIIGWILQTYYQDHLVSFYANRIFLMNFQGNRSVKLACDNRPYQLLA